MINVDGRRVDYTESGDGPAVLFIPGSFSTPAAWTIYKNCYPRNFVALALVFVDMVQRKKHEASKTLEWNTLFET